LLALGQHLGNDVHDQHVDDHADAHEREQQAIV